MANDNLVDAVCSEDTDGDGVTDVVEEYLGARAQDPCDPCGCPEGALYPSGGGGCTTHGFSALAVMLPLVVVWRKVKRRLPPA
jgi:hypothetical protein